MSRRHLRHRILGQITLSKCHRGILKKTYYDAIQIRLLYLKWMDGRLVFSFCCIVHLCYRSMLEERVVKWLFQTFWNCSKSSCFLLSSFLFISFSSLSRLCKSFVSRNDFMTNSSSTIFFFNCSFSSVFPLKAVRSLSHSPVNYKQNYFFKRMRLILY